MKKLLIIAFVLFQVTAIAQSHVFSTPKLATNVGNGWGRWVNGYEDIGIEKIADGYLISSYVNNRSQPTVIIHCKYKGYSGDEYIYYIYKVGTSLNDLMEISESYTIKTTRKLSLMAKGSSGVINIFLFNEAYAYDCY